VALWLPVGVAIVCLLVFGAWAIPGLVAGTFMVDLPLGPSTPAVALIAMGDTLAPVCAWLLLRRVGFRRELDRVRDALALIILAGFGSMLISGTVGCLALFAAGAVPRGRFWPTWSLWWSGDAMGVLVGVPFLLVLISARVRDLRPARWAELALLLASTTALATVVTTSAHHLLFLVFPPLIWAALRFGHTGAAPCVLIVSVVAATAAMEGYGPFDEYGVFGRLVTLQTFNGAVALTALLLAAMVSERDSARRAIDRVATDLARMTEDLERGQQKNLKGVVLDLVRAQRPSAPRGGGPPA
jgi:integral membrane sensor domain MASE1